MAASVWLQGTLSLLPIPGLNLAYSKYRRFRHTRRFWGFVLRPVFSKKQGARLNATQTDEVMNLLFCSNVS